MPAGRLPEMYNYKGKKFEIKEIIGRFKKDPVSKEIIIETNKAGKSVDDLGRIVNAAGYLIDDKGNIVNDKHHIIFHFWEIMYQEPPKLFSFTEFDIDEIKGTLDRDVTKNPRHDDEFDLDGRMINTLGYLIDTQQNIIDKYGKLVFRKDILSVAYGQDAKIPAVFTNGTFLKPASDDPQAEESTGRDGIVYDQRNLKPMKR